MKLDTGTELPDNLELTKEFKDTFNLINDTNTNLFITGKAGSGKSTLLEYFRQNTKKNFVTLAFQGITAIKAKGQTLHSFFKFPAHFISKQDIKILKDKVSGLKTWQKIVLVVLVLALFGSITGTGDSSQTTSETQNNSAVETTLDILNNSSVNWANYAPAVKQGITDLIDAQDCEGLQSRFDSADNNNEAQLNRTGESNVDLMSLLDNEMQNIGCY